ncbi:MAG: hypothetical protein ACRC5M_03385 [Anaeroplasmataceae bacterium]
MNIGIKRSFPFNRLQFASDVFSYLGDKFTSNRKMQNRFNIKSSLKEVEDLSNNVSFLLKNVNHCLCYENENNIV